MDNLKISFHVYNNPAAINCFIQAAIQFARSVPGVASALVGMTSSQHVQENLGVARLPLASAEQLATLV